MNKIKRKRDYISDYASWTELRKITGQVSEKNKTYQQIETILLK